jgi:predicted amidohydrolase
MVFPSRRHLNQAQRVATHGVTSFLTIPFAPTCVSGVFFLVSAYVPGFWFFIFLALVPFLFEVRRAKTLGHAAIQGALLGTFIIGGSTVATLSAGLASSIGALGPILEEVLVGLSWLLFFVPLVPTVAVFAILFRALRRLSFPAIILLGIAWVGLEYARMFLYNIATYASGVGNPPFFSAGFLGYVLADNNSFLQLASFGGVYALSALVVLVNILMCVALLTPRAHHRLVRVGGLLAILVVVALFPIASLKEQYDMRPHEPLSVGLISLYPTSDEDYVQQVEEATTELLRAEVDLVVLPEGAPYPEGVLEGVPAKTKTQILGTRFANQGGPYASVAEVGFWGEEREVVRGKSVLAAQGEYIVGLFAWGAMLAGLEEELVRFNANGSLRSAQWGKAFSVGESGARASALFCVEMLAPFIGADVVKKEGSNILAFMLAHNQFNNAYTLRVSTERFLKVRAVEAGVPLVASSRATKAYAIDAYGRGLLVLGEREESSWGVVRMSTLSTGQSE